MTLISGNSAAPAPMSYVKDVTAQNFMQEVVQPSLETPVLVYFTAAWCGPCKQYGPLLEKVVNAAKGRVRLARIDIDKNPQVAQQFAVQSVPMVYIFFQGQPIDALQGALPESQLKQLISQLPGGSPDEALQATLAAANGFLAEHEYEQASKIFKAVLASDEENIEAIGGLARSFIGLRQLDQAETLLNGVPQAKHSHEAIAGAKAALTLARAAPVGADEKALRAKIAANALDFDARYDLSGVLFAAGKQEEAIAELLEIIAKSRDWNEGAARARLLTFFEALGHSHPLTAQGRRKLSSILFS